MLGSAESGKFLLVESGISGKILLVESGILGFGKRNKAQGIRNPANNWNPESNKFHCQRLESCKSVERNPESKTVFIPLHDTNNKMTCLISEG